MGLQPWCCVGLWPAQGGADFGHAAHPPAPGVLHPQRVTGGSPWAFTQLRNEETSPTRFQIKLLGFSEQLIMISLVFPGCLPALCTYGDIFCGIFLNQRMENAVSTSG